MMELRNTGIDIVGDVPWGTHFCTFYQTQEDLLDILVPFFKTGLESKEFCLWIISNSERLTKQEAISALQKAVPDLDRHLSEGSIELVEHDQWFLEGGPFDLYRVALRFKEKLDAALAKGYVGIRLNGSPAWVYEEDQKKLIAFEQEADKVFQDLRLIASCSYPIAESGADELLDVARTHQFVITRRHGDWAVFETPELMQAKAELKKLNEELEQRVIERTKELRLANEELQREIIERQQAEALLHAKEQEFRAIVENAPDQIIRYDREFRRTYVNPAVARAYGLPAEAWIGKPIGSVIHDARLDVTEDELAQVRQRIAAVFDTGKSYEYEMTWPLPSGRRYYSVRLFPELDFTGAVSNVLGISRDITERKEAEEALRASEARLQAAVDAADIGLWDWELISGQVISLGHHDKLFGLRPGEFDGSYSNFERLVHPDDLEELNRVVWRARDGRSEYVHEFRVIWPDGTIHWITAHGRFEYNETGQAVRMYGAVLDITERKQAEQQLRRAEEQARKVLDAIPEQIWSGPADGTLDYCNYQWRAYAGLGVEEVQGEGWQGMLHPDDKDRVLKAWRESVVNGTPYEQEERHRRVDGVYRWFLCRGVPLRDAEGRIERWYGANTDIEDRKRAEEQLSKSESQLAEAQRLAQIGSWTWDLRTGAITWSNELFRIFGLQPHDAHDYGLATSLPALRDVMQFLHPEDRDPAMLNLESMLKTGEPHGGYYRILRHGGEERIVHSRGSVVSDELGTPIRMVGAIQDVTERKRAEEQLKTTSGQLRALSARLQSVKEEEATRIAREIHDELGSILTRLKWDLELLSKEDPVTQDKDELEKTRQRIKEMIQLVDGTIDAVRRISAELRPSALDDLGLASTLRMQTQQFQDRTGIVVTCECFVEDLGLSSEQSTALFRVFEEALTNVLRHAGATKVEVKLEKDDDYVILTMRDNGRGITDAEMSDQSSLGLLGMRERVHMIGGEISITGSEDKGTAVAVSVPRFREP